MGEKRQREGAKEFHMETGCEDHPEHLQGGGRIPEIRKHYFLDEYCIMLPERKKRPSDFKVPS